MGSFLERKPGGGSLTGKEIEMKIDLDGNDFNVIFNLGSDMTSKAIFSNFFRMRLEALHKLFVSRNS